MAPRALRSGPLLLLTARTAEDVPYFLQTEHAREAVESLYRMQWWNPFYLYAFIVMPSYVKFLTIVPPPNNPAELMDRYMQAVEFNAMKEIWQEGFDARLVIDVEGAIRSMYNAPVHAMLCRQPHEYRWSSASGKWDVLETSGTIAPHVPSLDRRHSQGLSRLLQVEGARDHTRCLARATERSNGLVHNGRHASTGAVFNG